MGYPSMLDQIQINDYVLDFYTLSIMICCYMLSFCNVHGKFVTGVISLIKYGEQVSMEEI